MRQFKSYETPLHREIFGFQGPLGAWMSWEGYLITVAALCCKCPSQKPVTVQHKFIPLAPSSTSGSTLRRDMYNSSSLHSLHKLSTDGYYVLRDVMCYTFWSSCLKADVSKLPPNILTCRIVMATPPDHLPSYKLLLEAELSNRYCKRSASSSPPLLLIALPAVTGSCRRS